MKVMRNEAALFLYFNKKWINQSHTLPKCWKYSEGNGDVEVPIVKGGCIIALHI
jgi:hypothetical protein